MLIYLLMVFFFFICFIIVGLILLQEGKGGGLAGMGGATMDGVMGVRNPLRRWTAWMSILFVMFTLGFNAYLSWNKSADQFTGYESKAKPDETTELPESATGDANKGENLQVPAPASGTETDKPALPALPPASDAGDKNGAAPAAPAQPAKGDDTGAGKGQNNAAQ